MKNWMTKLFLTYSELLLIYPNISMFSLKPMCSMEPCSLLKICRFISHTQISAKLAIVPIG